MIEAKFSYDNDRWEIKYDESIFIYINKKNKKYIYKVIDVYGNEINSGSANHIIEATNMAIANILKGGSNENN
jgi:hypothetical protein